MSKIIYDGNQELISDAVEDANYLFNLEEFYLEISKKPSFDFSNASGTEVAELIKYSTITALLNFYKPLPWKYLRSKSIYVFISIQS